MKAIIFLFVALLSSLSVVSADELPRRANASAESYPQVDVIYDSVTDPAGKG